MPLRVSLACLLTAGWLALSTPEAGAAEPPGTMVEHGDVEAALEALEADPNLTTTRKTRVPKWRSQTSVDDERSGVLKFLLEVFRWFAQTSRVFVWVVVALLIAGLALYLFRFLRKGPERSASGDEAPPTHVRDLDIRPESLPEDIGSAAWAAWERGNQRAALSLLYRGLLSRLVHDHAAPIRSSSTEGDCLALASERLPAPSREFAGRLIDVWLRAVYGGQTADAHDVRSLCEQFAARLARGPLTEQA